MSDTEAPPPADTQAPSDAPSGDAGGDAGGDDEQVVLTKAQLDGLYKSARNSAFAEARKMFSSGKREPQQPSTTTPDDTRIKRGLELLSRYERGEAFQTNVQAALATAKPQPSTSQPAAAQPQSEIGQLLELMKLDLSSRMAERLPKAPVRYESPGEQVRADLNDRIAAIPEDDPQRSAKIQRAVVDQLRNVKVRGGGSLPSWATNPTTKGK